jgi:hypothetical protein
MTMILAASTACNVSKAERWIGFLKIQHNGYFRHVRNILFVHIEKRSSLGTEAAPSRESRNPSEARKSR